LAQSPNQQFDFFEHLNAPEGFGVFLFPPKFEKPQDTLDSIQATVNAVAYLHDHLADTKIKARNAKGVSRILDWLQNYRTMLMSKAEVLRVETNAESNATDESGPGTTLNGHGG
jgi:hypothetical protein